MKLEKPVVEVLVASIDQEFAVRKPRPDWYNVVPRWPMQTGWMLESRWPCDISPITDLREMFEIGKLFVRVEEFGATVFDPVTRAVFRVNKTGAEIVRHLQEGMTTQQVAKTMQIKAGEVSEFVAGFEKAFTQAPG